MGTARKFNRTLLAVKSKTANQGEIGDAIRADVIADIEAGGQPIHGLGYFDECEVFLQAKGYTFDAGYLRSLYGVSAITARERWMSELDRRYFGRGSLRAAE